MLHLQNPYIFAPLKTAYGIPDGYVTEKLLNFYARRNKYIGAITPEPLYLEKGLRELPVQIGIDKDDKIEGLKKLTSVIKANGAKAIAHLNHPGRMANPKIPGNYFVSASAQACENGGAEPRAFDADEDKSHIISLFAEAAKRAERAEFDMIELQFGHGYLAAQFLSPKVNTRNDEYGGSLENRARLSLEILDAVKTETDLPVITRISGDEMLPEGFHLNEMKRFVKMLEQHGADAVHVSAGTACSTPPWFFQHMFVPKGKTWEMASELRKEIDIPVIYVGQINTAKDIEQLDNEHNAEYMAIGRALLADPDFLAKYLGHIKKEIRPCLACSDGCLGGVKGGKGLGCVVNPLAGREGEQEPLLPKEKKRYAVAGGGLAGMEAALGLRRRGHEVVLYEKDELGGQFNLAHLPPGKSSLKRITDYYKKEVHKAGVQIENNELTPGNLSDDFDGLIVATGALPAIPPIDGLHEYYWAEVLEEKHLPEGKKVLIIGGGLIGAEVAHKLRKKGNDVTIVEMLDEPARGMEMIERKLTLSEFKKHNVNLYLSSKVTKINGSKACIEGHGHERILTGIDIIIVAAGMRSYNPFEGRVGNMPVYTVGDARLVGKAQNAIRDAFDTVRNL